MQTVQAPGCDRPTAVHVTALVSLLLLAGVVGWSVPAHAQRGSFEVGINIEKTAYLKYDILVEPLEVLSGGQVAVDMAEKVRWVLDQDLEYSGFFRVGRGEDRDEDLHFEFAVEGILEGPLPGTVTDPREAKSILTLRLVSYPERQVLLDKRYAPIPSQVRTSSHHFVNQVVLMLTGEPGICLSRIVFSRGSGDRRDLYVVDYDGENLLRLTANRTLNLCPSWSPDLEHIAFTSYTRGQQGIYLLETATGKVFTVIATEGLNLGANWHPNGLELIVSLSKSGSPEIYRINLQGHVLRRLTFSPAIEISPTWSPGGQDIVFTSDRTGTPQLYIMDSDGANRRRLSFEGRYNDSAVWSQSGELIMYACRIGNYTRLVLISPFGENRRVITEESWRSCEDPSWAPDGRHVVFASDRTGTFKLYVLDVVDGTTRQLTFGEEPDITPAWSP
jgi:TolB protein